MTGDRMSLAGRVAMIAGADDDLCREASDILSERGASITLASGDLGDEATVVDLVTRLFQRRGRIDILINAVRPALEFATVQMTSAQDFRAVFRREATGPFLTMKHVIPIMSAAGAGSIVNVALVAPDRPGALGVSGAGVGAAVLGMTRTAAIECGGTGIRVNAVAPGTEATTRDIALVAAFLASDEASFITGAVYPVDGAR